MGKSWLVQDGDTIIIIAHRLLGLRACHNILTIETGRLVQDGSHEQLLRGNCRYAQLYRYQAADAQADIAKIEAQLPLKREQVEARRGLLEKGLTPKQQFRELSQELIALEGEGKMAVARANEGHAALATISGDAVEQPGGAGQPPRLIYTARIRLEKDVMKVDSKDVHLSHDVVAAVEIKTGKKAILVRSLAADAQGNDAGHERC